MTFTKDQLIARINQVKAINKYRISRDSDADGLVMDNELLDIALASLKAEAVVISDDMAYAFHHAFSDSSLGADEVEEIKTGLRAAFANVATPQPLTTSDRAEFENYQHLSDLYHAQEKRLFKLAQRIKGPAFDKYSHSPSQAIDVLEANIFGENDDASRAADMAAQLESARLHIAELEAAPPAPVGDGDAPLELLPDFPGKVMTQRECYRAGFEAGKALKDGWVACSERMPETDWKVLVNVKSTNVEYQCLAEIDENSRWWDEYGEQLPSPFVTHWQPLPAAPQQEVNGE